eukprot:5380_1
MSHPTLYQIDKLIHALQKPDNDTTTNPQTAKESPSMEISWEILNTNAKDDITIDSIKQMISQFASDRDWEQYHTPRNLLLALVGEIGELSEIFQWKGECKTGLPTFSKTEKIHLGEEMADCLIYLCRMADVCGINLKHAVLDKMEKNNNKYPAHIVKGSSKKYTEYANHKTTTQNQNESND